MEYVASMLVLVGLYIILASSFNLIIGFGGLISIAHPIFFALGAYTVGVLSVQYGVNPFLSVVAGFFVALVASFALSLPSLRISGDYLLITSIGFQLGLLEIIKNLDFVGGASGLGGIPNVVSGQRNLVFAGVSLAWRWWSCWPCAPWCVVRMVVPSRPCATMNWRSWRWAAMR